MKIDNWEKEFNEEFVGNKELDYLRPTKPKELRDFIRDVVFLAKIDAEMTESIKRYNQAKADGTLDKHFPMI